MPRTRGASPEPDPGLEARTWARPVAQAILPAASQASRFRLTKGAWKARWSR